MKIACTVGGNRELSLPQHSSGESLPKRLETGTPTPSRWRRGTVRRRPPPFGVGLSPLLVPFLPIPQLRLRFPREDQGPPATASRGWEPAPPASRPANLEEIPATRRALHLITKSGRSRRTPAQPENSPHPLLPQRFFRHQEAATSEINVIAPCCERLLQPQGLMKAGGM